MNKLLGRLFRPSSWVYYVMMLAFSVAAGVMHDYLLSAVSLAATGVVLAFHLIMKGQRRKALPYGCHAAA